MIFKKIRLKNFRQFKNDITIDLSPDSSNQEKTIAILAGFNGAGKTTLVQSVRYCFYGKNPNYLKIPNPTELLNDTIVNNIEELDRIEMLVEVSFENLGEDYIASRKIEFFKKKNKMIEDKSEFSISYNTAKSGYKQIKDIEADIKIYSIMPPGLVYLYLFDGERMEKNIAASSSVAEVKETVRAFLDIKKYEILISLIGKKGHSRTLINALQCKITTTKDEEKIIIADYESILNKKAKTETSIDRLKEREKQIDEKINQNKEIQFNIDKIKALSEELSSLEKEISLNEKQIEDKTNIYLSLAGSAILNKLLIKAKNDFDKLYKKRDEKIDLDMFYPNLHVDTLNKVLNDLTCICGNKFEANSKEYDRIKSLFENALPNDYSHHLNLINERLNEATNFEGKYKTLDEIKRSMVSQNDEIRKLNRTCDKKRNELEETERYLGLTHQIDINSLKEELKELRKELAEKGVYLKAYEKQVKKLTPKYKEVVSKSDENRSIDNVIDMLLLEKEKLENELLKKDGNAREILAEKFNRNLSLILEGDYQISLNEKYSFKINQNINGFKTDVTEKLSTGQSVVLSMTFIKSLLETAKESSDLVQKNANHGIIMDAGMATLDGNNVKKLSKYILSGFDQLIFLSIERQLRHELFDTIKGNIYKAFVISNNKHIACVDEVAISKIEELLYYKEENR